MNGHSNMQPPLANAAPPLVLLRYRHRRCSVCARAVAQSIDQSPNIFMCLGTTRVARLRTLYPRPACPSPQRRACALSLCCLSKRATAKYIPLTRRSRSQSHIHREAQPSPVNGQADGARAGGCAATCRLSAGGGGYCDCDCDCLLQARPAPGLAPHGEQRQRRGAPGAEQEVRPIARSIDAFGRKVSNAGPSPSSHDPLTPQHNTTQPAAPTTT